MSDVDRPTLIYFSSRGRAQPIRMLLRHVGVAFHDRHVTRDEWRAMKPHTGLGQLPVWIERTAQGEVTIPQSRAILRHLARRHGLWGRTEAETLAADIAAETADDLLVAYNRVRFSPAWSDEAERGRYAAETLPPFLVRFATLLGDRPWFAAEEPTFGDFVVQDALETHLAQWPECLVSHPSLAAFTARFAALPIPA